MNLADHSRTIARAAALVSAIVAGSRAAPAQMPTIPLLQNGFAGGGMTLAVNYGSTSGSSAYALAAGWGPSNARFQVSGAIGGVRPDTGSTWTGYGFRAAVPLYARPNDRLGIALFAGVGGASHDTTSIVRVPVGVGVGTRFWIGETRSISAYASPFFVWSRVSEKGTRAQGDNALRTSIAADLVISRNFGITAGYEFGGGADRTTLGGANGVFGAAVSYAFR